MNDTTKQSIEEQAKQSEQQFLNNISDELDRSCDGLDGHTQSRLNSAVTFWRLGYCLRSRVGGWYALPGPAGDSYTGWT